jgi:hypothetical protein
MTTMTNDYDEQTQTSIITFSVTVSGRVVDPFRALTHAFHEEWLKQPSALDQAQEKDALMDLARALGRTK